MLLDFAEYQDLGGTAAEDNYKKLENDAEDLINPITNDYYVLNSIDTDEDKYRVRCFKKALELQINFSNDIGASTPYGMSDQDIKSVSVDGTSVTKGTTPINFVTGGIYKLTLEYLFRGGFFFSRVPPLLSTQKTVF